jgi:hypothetical protein
VSGSGVQAKIGTVGRQVETFRAVKPLLVKHTMSGALSISAAAHTATAMASSVRTGPLWALRCCGRARPSLDRRPSAASMTTPRA